MLGKLSVLLSILLLSACMMPKEADIAGAAVIAELAQTQNARRSDIVVERVRFETKERAQVDATHRVPDVRVPHNVSFVCDATRVEDRWKVKCTERPTP